ncbi:hypothetical protein AJ79_06954 [Helicocarpus griseus UAMH5409]|uniref:small monomeric GTPase n=1 Tax=Helicocarpus griseus UAMH5409 TaxID=1447875 RepID=A0A2B7X7J2_9EURO|nr:hypothetical protein AJ79_06954 [Helicocarpus griseus UAMH5409]
MRFCKPFFPRRDKTKDGTVGIGDHGRGARMAEYILVVGGRVSECVMDRVILGDCFHGPTLIAQQKMFADPHHRGCTLDSGEEVVLEFLLLANEWLWSQQPMTLQCLRAAHGLVIVFCIEDRESFDKLVDDSNFLLRLKEEHSLPVILLGCEPGYCKPTGNTRQVTKNEAEDLAEALGTSYVEVRSKSGTRDLDYTPFRHLVKEIRSVSD